MQYEKLFRWCNTCHRISHKEKACPLLSEQQRREKLALRATAREPENISREETSRLREVTHQIPSDRSTDPSQMRRRHVLSPTDQRRSHRAGKEKEEEPHRLRAEPRPQTSHTIDNVWGRLESRDGSYREQYLPRKYGTERVVGEPSQLPKDTYRKRRCEESFARSTLRRETQRDSDVPPRKEKNKLTISAQALEPVDLRSYDSQRTMSDLPRSHMKAKQG
ncbi:unnamed protein product [Arabis nemorensis]|uniref:Zinc knuckle CX2CX4HX4C domain-containing protein n=1 Tax=Arabis nemorensis TaxID=586526 RepID=A0A565BL68_9BRAS|nr:unnamed protein product [Arabis nemorensis]